MKKVLERKRSMGDVEERIILCTWRSTKFIKCERILVLRVNNSTEPAVYFNFIVPWKRCAVFIDTQHSLKIKATNGIRIMMWPNLREK